MQYFDEYLKAYDYYTGMHSQHVIVTFVLDFLFNKFFTQAALDAHAAITYPGIRLLVDQACSMINPEFLK